MPRKSGACPLEARQVCAALLYDSQNITSTEPSSWSNVALSTAKLLPAVQLHRTSHLEGA